MPTIPESNDPSYKTMHVPSPQPGKHHNYCDCAECLKDAVKWPSLNRVNVEVIYG